MYIYGMPEMSQAKSCVSFLISVFVTTISEVFFDIVKYVVYIGIFFVRINNLQMEFLST